MFYEASSVRGGRGLVSWVSLIVRGGLANSEFQYSIFLRRLVRIDDVIQEFIKNMINLIFVNDWRDRYKGIIMLFEMAESNIDVVNMNVVKVQLLDLECFFLKY